MFDKPAHLLASSVASAVHQVGQEHGKHPIILVTAGLVELAMLELGCINTHGLPSSSLLYATLSLGPSKCITLYVCVMLLTVCVHCTALWSWTTADHKQTGGLRSFIQTSRQGMRLLNPLPATRGD